jgi:site-specific recombinase XerD
MITMSNWRERMVEDMRLHDLRPRTIGGYALAVRLFLERSGKSPEEATEEDVRRYVLHLRDERVQAPSSINIAVCALRFFFVHTLGREYDVFDLMRVHKPRTLPSSCGGSCSTCRPAGCTGCAHSGCCILRDESRCSAWSCC